MRRRGGIAPVKPNGIVSNGDVCGGLKFNAQRNMHMNCFPQFNTIHKFQTRLFYNSRISMHRNVFTFEIPIAHICSSCWFHVE